MNNSTGQSDTNDPHAGQVLGDYVILRKIGEGGGGEVFQAKHQRMERIVAIKILPRSMEPQAVLRFHREVKAAARLLHPHIVTAFDAGEHEGSPYLVLEYVEGQSLDELIVTKGPLQVVDTACDFIIQAARGLAYAHSQGIVHRDIKPGNLILDGDGVVKILDMGLARNAISVGDSKHDRPVTEDGLTSMGTIMGTVAFMSPEQARDAHSADHRTDVYSLGCTLYFLLTGRVVYDGEMIEALLAHARNPIPSLREARADVPERLDEVYQRMLAKRREDRHQTMNEVMADLEEFVVEELRTTPRGLGAKLASRAPSDTILQRATVVAERPPEKTVDDAPAVGIDLGTVWSAVAHIDNKTGCPVTIANAEGNLTTPSVVMIDGSKLAIGKKALEALQSDGQCVAEGIKRDLGRKRYHRTVAGEKYPPEALLGLILYQLTAAAGAQIGGFREVVIAVPACFDDARRKAVQDAAELAQLEVLDIINEPTAVALTYQYELGALDSAIKNTTSQKLLVCDFGGGAFDATLLEIAGANISVLASGGVLLRKDYDWDEQLVDEAARLFQKKYGVDPRNDLNASSRLRRRCEAARHELSDHDLATIEFDYQGEQLRVNISREQFQKLTGDILAQMRSTIEDTLAAARTDWASVDRVLLTGGSSRMPMIRNMLEDLSGKKPDRSVSVDQAVAHGAALHAAAQLARRRGQPPKFKIEEVNSHSMGVVAKQRSTGGKRHAILIPRNARLPASVKRTFKTQLAGQASFIVDIVQGESASLEQCSLLGQIVIADLPPDLPAGSPISVEFRCNTNGRLTVFLESPGSAQRVTKEITRPAGLSQADLDHWRDWVETTMLCADF